MEVSPSPSLDVELFVRTVAGDLAAQFRLDGFTLVGALKRKVEVVAGVPVSEQRLLRGADLTPLDDQQRLAELCGEGQQLCITLVRVTRRWAVSGDSCGVLCVWDLESGVCLQRLDSQHAVRCVAVDWHARVALCGTGDHSLKLWDLSRGACLREFGRQYRIRCVSMDWPARLALSGSSEPNLKLWDLGNARCIQQLTGHVGGVTCLAVDWKALRALSGSGEGSLHMWDLERATCTWQVHGHVALGGVGMDWRLRRAISAGSGSQALSVWDLERGERLRQLGSPTSATPCLAANVALQVAVSATCGGQKLDLWELEGGARPRELTVPSPVECVALSWAWRICAVGSSDCTLRLFDLENGACLEELYGHTDSITCVVMS